MKTARPQESGASAASKRAHFNPPSLTIRQQHIIPALLTRSRTREQIDAISRASNGPDEVLRLRALGLEVPCVRVPCFDRDGHEVQRGVYSLTAADRRQINRWLTKRQTGAIDATLGGWLVLGAVCVVLLMGVC